MAVHIRLSRAGTKKRPFYRLIVTDQRSPRDGRFLENIGTFDPSKRAEDNPLHLNKERLDYWRSCGAQPTATVDRILKRLAKSEAASA